MQGIQFKKPARRNKFVQIPYHAADLCEKLLSFCDTKEFSDICLITSDDAKFHAHKNILAASSVYFMAMFGGGLKESKASEVKLHEVDSEILKIILKFIYTGGVELCRDTIEKLLRAANFFQINHLIVECCIYIAREVEVCNCLEMSVFAKQQGLLDLFELTSKYASKHFEQVSKTEEFLKISEKLLTVIVTNDTLDVTSEEQVFLSMVNWIEHDKENREKSAFNIFSKIRYWLLSFEFIKTNRPKICNLDKCAELVFTWLEWHASPECRAYKALQNEKPDRSTDLVIFSRGRTQTYSPELRFWSCDTLSWYPSNFDKMCTVNNKLIFSYTNQPLKSFDLKTKKLIDLPELSSKRIDFGLAVLNNVLYVVGGRSPENENIWNRFVEKFNFSSGQWEPVEPMITPLSHIRTAVAGGAIYAIGNGGDMHCYSADSNKWTVKPGINKHINATITSFGFTGAKDKLFVVGGLHDNGTKSISGSVYSFNASLDQWVTEKSMGIEVLNPNCTTWNNRLIVSEGYHVQEYHIEFKKWRVMPRPNHIYIGKHSSILNMVSKKA